MLANLILPALDFQWFPVNKNYEISNNQKHWQMVSYFIFTTVFVDGKAPQMAKFKGPTWGPPGSCRPKMGPMLAPWTLLSGTLWCLVICGHSAVQIWFLHTYGTIGRVYLVRQELTHWGWDKWPLFSRWHFQMHFLEWQFINSDHWSLLAMIQLTIFQHWFR